MRSKGTKAAKPKVSDRSKKVLTPLPSPLTPHDFKVCDPAYSLCPDCAKALREGTCPRMKENLKRKTKQSKAGRP